MLTERQGKLLRFLEERLRATARAPSFEEMRAHLGLRSKSGVHRLLCALSERGFVRRLPYRARALEVLRSVDSVRMGSSFGGGEGEGLVSIPILGKVAAGVPLEALSEGGEEVECPNTLFDKQQRGRQHYALRVEGESMIEAGILDGDTIIVEATSVAHEGELVIALVDEETVTLKRLRRTQGKVILEAENHAYPSQVFTPDRVRIQGRVTGLMRRYPLR